MKICEDLRRAVLQAAIQGKLTEQKAEDGTAEDLLKEIRKEKAKLIAEEKIKKEKALPPIKDDEKPFDIPENWVWVRLGKIGYFVRGNGIKRAETTETGKPCIRYGQMYTTFKNSFTQSQSFVPDKIFERSVKVHKNDILMALTGENNVDIALAVAYMGDDEIAMGGDMTKFTHIIDPMYIVCVINSAFAISYKSKLATGNIIVHISNDKLASIPFPLPPLAEQHRIVERVDALMSKIDELEKIENELEAMKKKFPGDLRDALLQAAIQGKLTEQKAEDGTAEDLLKEIRKEKAKLIADGKIKQEKVLPPIKDDEKPFDIPENWVWVRLGDVCETNIGLTYKPSDISKNGTLVLRSSNIQKGKIDYKDSVYVSTSVPNSALINKGDILICVRNGSRKLVGKSAIVDKDGMAFGAFMAKIHSNYIKNRYIQYYIESHVFRGGLDGVGTETINQITQKMLKESLIPLPPLAEQHRIVERLNELLPLCEAMKGQEE